MNKLVSIISLSIVLLTLNLKATCQANIVFTDTKDSELYKIKYFVFAEGKLGDFRDDIRGVTFKSSSLMEFFKNNNRKIINVIFLRVLTGKASNKIEQIRFYSTRDQDTKLVEELTLTRRDDPTDIDLLATKTNL